MDLKAVDVRVFLNDYVDVWHPNRAIRLEARGRLRGALAGVHVLDVEKLVEWMRIPCLLRMRDMCVGYLGGVGQNVAPGNVENLVRHCMETVEYLEWINDQLGIREAVEQPDYDLLRRKAFEKVNAGTLLAYC